MSNPEDIRAILAEYEKDIQQDNIKVAVQHVKARLREIPRKITRLEEEIRQLRDEEKEIARWLDEVSKKHE